MILAGTVVPLGSSGLFLAADYLRVPEIPLILVATTGFTIGMTINYGLAYRLGRWYVARTASTEKLEEAMLLWNRWSWSLHTIFGLIPFLPVELLCVVCGILKTRIQAFLLLTFLPRLVVFTILAFLMRCFGILISSI